MQSGPIPAWGSDYLKSRDVPVQPEGAREGSSGRLVPVLPAVLANARAVPSNPCSVADSNETCQLSLIIIPLSGGSIDE